MLTGRQFFPELISGPFHHGLVIVFSTAIVLLVIAAGVSLLRGGRYVYEEHVATAAGASQAAADGSQAAAADGQPAVRASQRAASNGDYQAAADDGQPATKAHPPAL